MSGSDTSSSGGVRRWIPVLVLVVTALLAWQGRQTGEWRAVVVSEVQVLVVAAAAWIGLR